VTETLGRAPAPKVSTVIVVDGAERTIRKLVEDLVERLAAYRLEIVLVNDASADGSDRVCLDLVAAHPDVVIYAELARRFGEQSAVMTGLRFATGDFVVTLEDDLTHPASEVTRLLHEARQGSDVVYGQFEAAKPGRVRRFLRLVRDAPASWLIGTPRHLRLSTFRCLSRFLVDEITQYGGPFPYVDGLVLRSTSRIGAAVVRPDPRRPPQAARQLRNLLELWLHRSTSFSMRPLRAVVAAGFLAALAGAGVLVYGLVESFVHPEHSLGWAPLVPALVAFSGLQLVMLGAIGEYLGRLLMTVDRTPQAVIRRVVRGRDVEKVRPMVTHGQGGSGP
jgi:undecaprenyl-phosphate 4-deoxy-4-formamido-L-arabinose transferase